MGDRGNIVIRDPQGGDVWLYSHWGGTELPEILRTALAKNERWDDPAYLARIIFCEMVKGQEDGTTGFGISTGICDNNHDILLVKVGKQIVEVYAEDRDTPIGLADKPKASYTFKEFVANGLPQEIQA